MNEDTNEGKKVSQKKIEANRRNARRSTGPKTLEGKNLSRMNALTHGLSAKEFVIRQGCGKENRRELELLIEDVRKHFEPADAYEDRCVRDIALCRWKLQRADRCECAQIDKQSIEWSPPMCDQQKPGEKSDPINATYNCATLGAIKSELELHGTLSFRSLDILRDRRGVTALCVLEADRYFQLVDRFETDQILSRSGTPTSFDRDKAKAEILAKLDEEIEAIKKAGTVESKLFAEHCKSSQRSVIIPLGDALNGLLRYEAAASKRLQSSTAELVRCQRRRKGELIPPPVKIEVSREG